MGSTVKLPSVDILQKWTSADLVEWLKQVNLSECVPTFQDRKLDGATLLSMPTDKIITELSDLKIKHRMQVAKAVTECKTKTVEAKKQLTKCISECKHQASTCKKAVNNLKRHKKKRNQMASGSAGEPDDYDDGWGSSEFDTDDEEDDQSTSTASFTVNGDHFPTSDFPGDNLSSNGPGSLASSDSGGHYNDTSPDSPGSRSKMTGRTAVWTVKGPSPQGTDLAPTAQDPGIVLKSVSPLKPLETSPAIAPKPKGVIPKPPNAAPQELGSGLSVSPRRTVPKLQRPPSHPPAPPVATPPVPTTPVPALTPPPSLRQPQIEPETPCSEEDDCWQYEIPNSGIPDPGPAPPVIAGRGPPLIPPLSFRLPPPTAGPPYGQWGKPQPVDPQPETPNDTYELLDQQEETYEAVDDHQQKLQFNQGPCLPPRKPASLPPNFLPVPPLPEKPPKMVSTSPLHPAQLPSNVENAPPLPTKGGNISTRTISQLKNIVQSKFQKRPSQDSTQFPTINGSVTVNGSSPVSVPPLPITRNPSFVVQVSPKDNTNNKINFTNNNNEEPSSMTLRPLPPVPSSQARTDQLHSQPYYQDIEREEAVQRLLNLGEDYVYLVRPSRRGGEDNPYTLTLIHAGKPFHLNVRQRPDGQYALGRRKEHEMMFESVSSLISHHQQHPIYLSAQGESMGTSLLRKHP